MRLRFHCDRFLCMVLTNILVHFLNGEWFSILVITHEPQSWSLIVFVVRYVQIVSSRMDDGIAIRFSILFLFRYARLSSYYCCSLVATDTTSYFEHSTILTTENFTGSTISSIPLSSNSSISAASPSSSSSSSSLLLSIMLWLLSLSPLKSSIWNVYETQSMKK